MKEKAVYTGRRPDCPLSNANIATPYDALKRMEAKGYKNTEHYERLKYKIEMLEQGKAKKRDVTIECVAAIGALFASWTTFIGGRAHTTEEIIKETQKVVNEWRKRV
jgi:hypothetical protein